MSRHPRLIRRAASRRPTSTRSALWLRLLVPMLLLATVGVFLSCSAETEEPTLAPSTTIEPTATAAETPASNLRVRVDGNQLVNASGEPLRLVGINRSGTESGCARGTGIFDFVEDMPDLEAIAAWGVNAVRIPLNEHCWLGRNDVDQRWSGEAYREAIQSWVTELSDRDLIAVLALSWSGTGADLASGGDLMANAEHSLDFWASVAETFKDEAGVVFDLYSSPNGISWGCWERGCEIGGVEYVGMQALVDTVRVWGAQQPVIVTGIDYGADLSGWLAHRPNDPAGQLVAGFQSYSFGKCTDLSCLVTLDPVLREVPMIVTELAEDTCQGDHVAAMIDWADSRGVSWLAWAFNDWGDCEFSPLIADESGSPSLLGVIVKGRIAASIDDPLVTVPAVTPTPTKVPVVRVEGNRLVTADGEPLTLRGVNRAGTEYACAQGWGFFDVNGDEQIANAIAEWGANAVRVSLNEHCWLGRNGVAEELGGQAYQDAMVEWVRTLHDAGLITVITLHWAGFGDQVALFQERMANVEHSIDFWESASERFRDEPGVIYQLYAEPHDIDWDCWQFGCVLDGYQAASMQQLLDAVRSSGSTQPVIVSGINFAADLSEWTKRAPFDPEGQLIAGFHTYNFSACSELSCWDETIAPIAQSFPVITVELGESTCDGSYVNPYIDWAEEQGISWIAWTFNAWASCTSDIALIVDEFGTPTPLGEIIRARLMDR